MEVGQIVAAVCAIYGWTPDYVLYCLSWPQIVMFHRYGFRYDFLRRGTPLATDDGEESGEEGASSPGDGPDIDAIEARYGDIIRRGGMGND